jgi:hypothetical protein
MNVYGEITARRRTSTHSYHMNQNEVSGLPHTQAVLSPAGIRIGLRAEDAAANLIQGDQKVSMHLMITIQKITSNVQSVPRQSPCIY